MFVGHYGMALGAKAIAPALPLSGLMLSTQLMDVAWSIFILTGVEHMRLVRGFTASNDLDLYDIPYSHGLLTSLGWSILAGAAAFATVPGCTPALALLMGAVCWSHWFLDLLVHTKDLPLIGRTHKVGLGLWNYKRLTLAIELVLLFGGTGLFLQTLAIGSGLWWFTTILTSLLGVLQVYSAYGPPVASVSAYAGQALSAYLAVYAACRIVEAVL